SSYGVFPPAAGNAIQLLTDGEEAYPAMLEAIRRAEHHVHFCFYIWRKDTWGTRFRDALAERAAAGVKVRALYDDLGSASVDRRFLRPLRSAGAQVIAFLPNRIFRGRWSINFRNHRKILVTDDRVAFIGGINIGDEYASDGWRDFMVRVEGPVVDQVQEVFADDWHFASGGESIAEGEYFGSAPDAGSALCNVVASGPDTESQETLDAFFIALNTAKERVELMTPYFVPDRTLLMTLRTLCVRGVKVTLILPGVLDHAFVQWASRSYYRELLLAGVEIYEYRHTMLHGKAMIVDGALSFVGSANLDNRSFRLNFEASLFVRDWDLNADLSAAFEKTRAESLYVRLSDYPEPTGVRALGQAIVQLSSPLL
ncbi:MAG: cardiolipin synthase, partial [Myxococcota bacterium]